MKHHSANRPFLFTSLLIASGLAASCDVDQTQAGELPDVDVDVESGQLPAYDVDWADVDVGTTEEVVEVPKLKVVMETETVTVPSIDVDMPDDDDDRKKVKRTIQSIAQVPGPGYDIEIQSIHQANDTLYVVSRLSGKGTASSPEVVSDSVVINAPEIDVRHVIVGKRPEGAMNEQYRYVESLSDLDAELTRANRIYSRG